MDFQRTMDLEAISMVHLTEVQWRSPQRRFLRSLLANLPCQSSQRTRCRKKKHPKSQPYQPLNFSCSDCNSTGSEVSPCLENALEKEGVCSPSYASIASSKETGQEVEKVSEAQGLKIIS